jgi:ketosteroid isomerase-like protein
MRLRKAFSMVMVPLSLMAVTQTVEEVRKDILAAYQKSLDALQRGDAEAAMAIETPDWISITVGQKPVTLQEVAPGIRRDIASMKPPPGWVAAWRPDYEKNGTGTGIQIYDVKLTGDQAIVLYLIGATHPETIDGATHNVWNGSHIRDTWVKTASGWRRRMHEKLTINERMVDARPAASTSPK